MGVPLATHRIATRTVAVLAVLAALVLPATVALAHPGGEVPRARIGVEGREVILDWIAAPDDGAEVLVAAGVWPEEIAARYLDVAFGGPEDQLPSDEEIRAGSRDPAVAAYLSEHLALEQDGNPCPGTVHPPVDLLTDGVRVTFRCASPPGMVRLTISLLHDRDPAYRTFSLDGSQRVAIHTAAEPTHDWPLDAFEPPAAQTGLLLGAIGLVLGVGGAGLHVLWRSR